MNYNPSSLIPFIPESFPSKITTTTSTTTTEYTIQIHKEPSNVKPYLNLVKINLDKFYTSQHGHDWELEKEKEMKEDGLLYISYHDSIKNNLIAFISLMDTLDNGIRVLYLYEIHIDPIHQGEGIGKFLINGFHQLAFKLSKSSIQLGNLKGTKLTVFSGNEFAINWYKKFGYKLSDDSPVDKKLRNGKIIKPNYYLLFRSIMK